VAFVGLGFIVLGLSACDPGHPFDDVQVKVFSNGDGRATMSVEVIAESTDGSSVDEAALLEALATEMAIGQVVGTAGVPPDRHSSGPSIQLEGVDQARLTVSLSTVLAVMDQFGLGENTTVFVSVCSPAQNGRASGDGVELAHRSSCATWEPAPRPGSTDAVAVLTFENRNAPSNSSVVLAVVLAILGVASAAVYLVASGLLRKAGVASAGVAIVTSLVTAAWAAISNIRLNDTWFDTGQTFDEMLTSGYRTATAVALLAGVAVPVALLLVGAVHHRRRTRGDRLR